MSATDPQTPDYWELGYLIDGEWRFERHRYSLPDQAISAATMKFGTVLLAELEDNGTYRVTRLDNGATIACVRLMTHVAVGEPGLNGLGPLRRWRGLTWVGWLNFLVLRWFLFRIYYVVEPDGSISKYGARFIPSWRW